MGKIDLQSLLDVESGDGSIISSGAIVKFDSQFHIGSLEIITIPKMYRSRELFESGYTDVHCLALPPSINIEISSEDEFNQLTVLGLNERLRDYLNAIFEGLYFEVVTT